MSRRVRAALALVPLSVAFVSLASEPSADWMARVTSDIAASEYRPSPHRSGAGLDLRS